MGNCTEQYSTVESHPTELEPQNYLRPLLSRMQSSGFAAHVSLSMSARAPLPRVDTEQLPTDHARFFRDENLRSEQVSSSVVASPGTPGTRGGQISTVWNNNKKTGEPHIC